MNTFQYCLQHPIEALSDFIKQRDAFFLSDRSPLTETEREDWCGLSRFPDSAVTEDVTEEWRMVLPLLPFAEEVWEFPLETSEGGVRYFRPVGRLSLSESLSGCISGELLAFVPLEQDEPDTVFIPFRDDTSGHETYAAGRYLDAPVCWKTRRVLLDFHWAMQPLCAYGAGFSCALPPAENTLRGAVRVGECLPQCLASEPKNALANR